MQKNFQLQLTSPSTQYFQIVRSFGIRYLAYLRQKSNQPQSLDQLQITISKILNQNQAKQVILSKLLGLQLKGDYHQVIALTLMQDLAKWSRQYYEQIIDNNDYKYVLQAIVQQSVKLLNSQQQFHTIVPKQNDLLRELLITPHIVNHSSIDGFRTFYRKLKDVKQFYPQTIKQHQKIVFLKTVQQCIQVCSKYQSIKTLQFIFSNIFAELEVLEPTHQYVTSRLKLLKKLIKNLWFFHDQIIYKTAFVVMKFSQQVLILPHLFNSVLSLYEDLLPILLYKVSPAPLIIFNHLIVNNIKKLLQDKVSSTLSLQILLNALTQIFNSPFIEYFMKNYDANFMEESISQVALNILFEFVQNRANQKKSQYDIFKKYLKKATDSIRSFLNKQQPHIIQPSQKLLKFYEVKRKQYLQIVQDMNQKPKKIFKKLQSISNKQIRQQIMKKYSRIAKHSTHIENKKMIDLFAANNATSEQLFSEYVKLLFSNLSKDVNLEQFLRFFSSNFFLNGESQQILRVLDKITVLFYNHQPLSHKVLKNSDSTYTFANAIILLNSDLHNPSNEQKMSLQSFYKICKKINAGDDLPTQMLTSTYTSIKKNKINTFRQKSQMCGISPSNFVLICNKEQQNKLDFYDLEMRMLTNQNFYNFWIFDLLSSIIDERQTMKLEQLIERFVYDDNSYECEVIELVRKLSKKKPHIPLHAMQKILQHANFKNCRTSQKTISYLWLAVNLIQQFPSFLPTNVICQLLIFTWRMRSQIRDDMHLRQRAQIKRIRRMIKQYQKRQTKKSIMDMFSSFLSSKEQDSQPQTMEQFSMSQTNIKKMNYKILTQKVLDVLIRSSSSSLNNKQRVNHRVKAIQFFIGYLRNDEQKIFEQFLSLLYLIFHLLYRYNIHENRQQKLQQTQSPRQQTLNSPLNISPSKKPTILSTSLSLSTQLKSAQKQLSLSQFEQTIQDLFYQLLGLKQSSITKRIQNLKKKDMKKYQMLQSYSHYWVLKILINKIQIQNKGMIGQLSYGKETQLSFQSKQNKQNTQNKSDNNSQTRAKPQRRQNNHIYLLNKSVQYIQKTDKQIYMDLVYQFQQKAKQIFSVSLTKSSPQSSQQNMSKSSPIINNSNSNGNNQKQIKKETKQNVVVNQNKQQVQNIEDKKNSQEKDENNQMQKKQQKLNNKELAMSQNCNQNSISSQQKLSPHPFNQHHQQQQQLLIQSFIFNYRKLILQFYVNCIRLVGKQEMKKNKQWRWLVQLQKMIKQVMQNYQEKVIKHKQSQKEEQSYKQKQIKKQLVSPKLQQKIQKKQLQRLEQQQSSLNNTVITNEINTQSHTLQAQSNKKDSFSKQTNQSESLKTKNKQNQQIKSQNLLSQVQMEQAQLMQKINKQLFQQNSTSIQQNTQIQQNTKIQQKNIQQSNNQNIQSQTPPQQSKRQNVSQQKQQSNQEKLIQNQSNTKSDNIQFTSKQNQLKQSQASQNQNSQNKQEKQPNLIQQQQQALKKLMQLYSTNYQSSQMLSMPFYML